MSVQPRVAAAEEVPERLLASTSLLDAVRDLHRDVEATTFPLEVPGVEAARASRTRLLDQLADHLLPRLRELSAPAVVVVAGSTGAGKSTLVNSLLGTEVSAAGVLRPTTRRPVLVHHSDDGDLLATHPVLEAVEVVVHDAVPRGVALLDAPDLDSVLEANRASAHRLLEAADLWLFVTTAARYGDALPWRVLEGAMERGASVAMVLNRVPPESLPTVRGDLLERLRGHDMHGVPLFVVPDVGPHEGLLGTSAVAPISRWLTMLAGPDRARTVIARTLRGSLAALRPWVDELAEAVQDQADAAADVARELDAAAPAPVETARASVHAGAVADGAGSARWAELTTPGGPLSGVVRSGRPRGSRRAGQTRSRDLEPLVEDLQSSAAATLIGAGAHGERVLRTHLTRAGGPAGGATVAEAWSAEERAAERAHAAELSAQAWVRAAEDAVRSWVRSRGASAGVPVDRRTSRRVARAERALGQRGTVAVTLAAAAGLEEARVLLEELFGPHVTELYRGVAADLADRAADQVARERASVQGLLDVPALAPDAAATLRLRRAVLKVLT